ncbi:MAG: hypothetical protein Q4G13_01100 [Moraxella sp.]|nr:hypothetical protein [Moraxella sp.]
MTTKSTKAQLQAVARYQANSERWTAAAKNGTDRQKWLSKAKNDDDFVADFWTWLKNRYDNQSD